MNNFIDSKKTFLKNLVLNSNVLSKINHLKHRIVILRYHSVKDKPGDHDDFLSPGIVHSKDEFYNQMELVSNRYDPISVDDLDNFFYKNKELPKNPALVTFDDGYADNIEIAVPILNRFGIRACFYITVDPVEKCSAPWYVRLRYGFWNTTINNWYNSTIKRYFPLSSREERELAFFSSCHICATLSGTAQESFVNSTLEILKIDDSSVYNNFMMTWDQVRALIDSGHDVGSHTLTHPNLVYIDEHDAANEVVRSKEILQNKLSVEIKHFSFPNPALEPNCNNNLANLLKKAGYTTAVTCNIGSVEANNNPLLLSRMCVPFNTVDFWWCMEKTFILGR